MRNLLPKRTKNPSAPAPLVIAHRGASAVAPENTLAAFKLALAMGADGVEFDVNLSADGVPVVIHDRRLSRTTSGAGWVSAFPVTELQRLDAGKWFERRLALRPRARRRVGQALSQYSEPNLSRNTARIDFSSERVPTLEEVFALLAPAKLKRLYVELKGEVATKSGMLAATLELVRRHRLERAVTLLSFDHQIIARAKAIAPDIRAAVTVPASRNALASSRAIIRAVETATADEAALHFGLVTRRLVATLRERGIAVSVWTANNRVLMRRLVACGVDAIMTNFPDRLHQVLGAAASD